MMLTFTRTHLHRLNAGITRLYLALDTSRDVKNINFYIPVRDPNVANGIFLVAAFPRPPAANGTAKDINFSKSVGTVCRIRWHLVRVAKLERFDGHDSTIPSVSRSARRTIYQIILLRVAL